MTRARDNVDPPFPLPRFLLGVLTARPDHLLSVFGVVHLGFDRLTLPTTSHTLLSRISTLSQDGRTMEL